MTNKEFITKYLLFINAFVEIVKAYGKKMGVDMEATLGVVDEFNTESTLKTIKKYDELKDEIVEMITLRFLEKLTNNDDVPNLLLNCAHALNESTTLQEEANIVAMSGDDISKILNSNLPEDIKKKILGDHYG